MSTSPTYTASKLSGGTAGSLREQSLTRWLSRDLMQAAGDFCRNLGLYALYVETGDDAVSRMLFWRLPPEATIEVRSARTKSAFFEFDQASTGKRRRLLSLHINADKLYSAAWISAEHFDAAKAFLAVHGIAVATVEGA